MKKLIIAILVACVLTTTALAAIPQEVKHEEQDEYRFIEKVYELPPGDDPTQLIGEPFEFLGYSYTLYSLTKQENRFEDIRQQTEMVTVETQSKEMADVLKAIAPTIEYEHDGYRGLLTLDHTSISTEVSGYSTQYYTVTDTKTLPGLDRNDPSYVPRASDKNGVSLSLDSVQWSVDGYDEDMNPVSYTAYASYSSGYSAKVAQGYVTSAVYRGTVTKGGISSITYTVVFIGEEFQPEIETDKKPVNYFLYAILAAILLMAITEGGKALLKDSKNMKVSYQTDGDKLETIAHRRICTHKPVIDLRKLSNCPEELIIEIDGKTAERLAGKIVTVKLDKLERLHIVEPYTKGDYLFGVNTKDVFEEDDK